jgi:hypothetical protein
MKEEPNVSPNQSTASKFVLKIANSKEEVWMGEGGDI